MNYTETDFFIKSLKQYGLTKQQIKTLRGQALSGNLDGARKGIARLIEKGGKKLEHTKN